MNVQPTNLPRLRDAVMSTWNKVTKQERIFGPVNFFRWEGILCEMKAVGGALIQAPNKVASEATYLFSLLAFDTEVVMIPYCVHWQSNDCQYAEHPQMHFHTNA